MKAIEEYNEVETFYHGINNWAFNRLIQEAGGAVENIILFGRVFNPDLPLLEAESEQDYEEVQGAGYVYACDFYNRENATPGASAQAGVTLILGWDGTTSEDAINKRGGEYLVPLASYKVIGIVD